MFDETNLSKALEDLTVADAIVSLQIVDRLVSSGNVRGSELTFIANLRQKLVNAVNVATGINYDAAMAQAAQAQAQAASQAPATQEAPVEEVAEAPKRSRSKKK